MKAFDLFFNYDPSDPPRVHHKQIDPAYWDWFFEMLEGTGLTFHYRCNLAGRAYYHSRHMARFGRECIDHRNAQANSAQWHRVADILDGHDPLADAAAAARRHGVAVNAWFNFNEFHCARRGWLDLTDPLWYERPRKYWCTRDGSRFYHGVPQYGDVDVQQRLLNILTEALDYGVDGIYLSSRTHSWWPLWQAPGCNDHLTPFGFNDCVVEAYRQRHGIDIRYDDYDDDAWHRIKGDHYSSFVHRAGALVHGRGKKLTLGIFPDRYLLIGKDDKFPAMEHVKLYKDWEQWAASGSIDALCSEQYCPHFHKFDGGDVMKLRATLPPAFPVYSWVDLGWFVNRDGQPFSMANWDRPTPRQMLEQIGIARDAGASGAVLHTLYHYTAADTNGQSIGGYGTMPRMEYFDALRQLNAGR
jgi:hypothetical protein